jgi:hypothetical protein
MKCIQLAFREHAKLAIRRGVHMFYPFNLYVGIFIAIFYCFIFWKMRNLGKYRIPLFVYAVVMQFSFLASFAWFVNSIRADASLSREDIDAFFDGVFIFYFLLVVPFMISLIIQTCKGIWKLEVEKASKIIMMIIFILPCLVVSVIGLYLHVFFYYGFAP